MVSNTVLIAIYSTVASLISISFSRRFRKLALFKMHPWARCASYPVLIASCLAVLIIGVPELVDKRINDKLVEHKLIAPYSKNTDSSLSGYEERTMPAVVKAGEG